jgi:uncharacterized DUF497 family protein
MLIEYTFQGIQFEWDRQKAEINLQKHGISFETACEAFLDPFVQSIDVDEVDEELREAIIGMTISWKLLYVIYTIRNEKIFRIISARSVTKIERKKYEEY